MKARAAVAVLLCAACASVPAAAQPSDRDRAAARVLAQKAQEALEAGDFKVAAETFAKAEGLVHAPTLLFGLAMAQRGLGKWVEAKATLERIVRDGVPRNAPAPWSAAVKDAQRELGELSARIPTITVSVSGAASAEITLDGAPVEAGKAVAVDPGKHTARAVAPGSAPVERTVTLSERAAETITLTVGASAAPVGEGGAGDRPWQKPAGIAAASVGGALLVVGAATGIAALGKRNALAKACPDGQCHGQQAAIDSYNSVGNASTATFVLGAAFAAAGVVLLVTAPRPAPTSAWIAPVIGPGGAGVRGGF